MILKGKVLDKITKAPIFGAVVYLAGTSYGTQTDINGNFSLTAPSGTYELNIKNIGYTSLENSINLSKDLTIEVSLNPEAKQLKEVTVTAQANPKIDYNKFIIPAGIGLGILLLLFRLNKRNG
jgi:hypothetical protein